MGAVRVSGDDEVRRAVESPKDDPLAQLCIRVLRRVALERVEQERKAS